MLNADDGPHIHVATSFFKKTKRPDVSDVKVKDVNDIRDKKRLISNDDRPNKEFVITKRPLKRFKTDLPVATNNEGKDIVTSHVVRKTQVPGGVIASLFNNNPEIPVDNVKESSNTVNCEPLFSSNGLDDLGVHGYLVSNLKQSFGFVRWTTVQEKSIPILLKDGDVLIKSQTGSGKTLAYAIPLLHHMQEIRPEITRESGTRCLVILPTRELVLQTYEVLVKLCKSFARIVPACLMGGESRKSEKRSLRKGVNILVTTPKRLLDHLDNTSTLDLTHLKFLVLDEADRLLDMGYEKDISDILARIDQIMTAVVRRTVMLSATLTTGVEKLAGLSLRNPIVVDVAENEWSKTNMTHLVAPEQLKQYVIVVPMKLRLVTLIAFVVWKCTWGKQKKILVFMSTQDMVDYHCALMEKLTSDKDSNLGLGATGKDEDLVFNRLHGNMSQPDRQKIFKQFRDSKVGVLFTTDVAARGLDLNHVDWIVQYSAPSGGAREYVHRIGRTARMDSKGYSLLFLLPSEISYIDLLRKEGLGVESMDLSKILDTLIIEGTAIKARGRVAISMQQRATMLQLRLETLVMSDRNLLESARNSFVSYSRAYASYPIGVRELLPFKQIHLGHLAKALALRETPGALGRHRARPSRDGDEQNGSRSSRGGFQKTRGGFSNDRPGRGDGRSSNDDFRRPAVKRKPISEFDSGL